MDKGKLQYFEDFAVYELDFPALAAGANANGVIQIQADSDFKLIKMTQQTDLAAAAQTTANEPNPLATVLITDTGSGRALMNSPVPIPSIFGTGELPFILPIPRIFKANTAINVSITSYVAAGAQSIRLSFIGTKIFRVAG